MDRKIKSKDLGRANKTRKTERTQFQIIHGSIRVFYINYMHENNIKILNWSYLSCPLKSEIFTW